MLFLNHSSEPNVGISGNGDLDVGVRQWIRKPRQILRGHDVAALDGRAKSTTRPPRPRYPERPVAPVPVGPAS